MEGLIKLIAANQSAARGGQKKPPEIGLQPSHETPEEVEGRKLEQQRQKLDPGMEMRDFYPGGMPPETQEPGKYAMGATEHQPADVYTDEWDIYKHEKPEQAAKLARGAEVGMNLADMFAPEVGMATDVARLGAKAVPFLAGAGIRKIKSLADDAVEAIGKATKTSDGPFRVFKNDPTAGDQMVFEMTGNRHKTLDAAVAEGKASGMPYKVAGKKDIVYATSGTGSTQVWSPPTVDANGPVGMIVPPTPEEAMGAYTKHYAEDRSSAIVPTLELGGPPKGAGNLEVVGKGKNPLQKRIADADDRSWYSTMQKRQESMLKPAVAGQEYYVDPITKKEVGLRLGAIHGNDKTGMSLDFSTLCGKRCSGKGACLYCYVDNVRVNEKLTGATGGGKGLMESPYMRDILTMPDEVVKSLNETGGLRMFSFGDFRPGVDDLMVKAALDDARKRGLKIKAITKEAPFIEQFAKEYEDILSINVSYDELPAGVTNAGALDDLVALKKRFPNVRVRTVALNEDQLVRHLADPRIDVVTPYHGTTNPEQLVRIIKESNPVMAKKLGDEKLLEMLSGWKDMGNHQYKSSPKYQALLKKYPKKLCCSTGNDFTCPTKCGTANKVMDITEKLKRII